jgi:alpha,alpha-trehalase
VDLYSAARRLNRPFLFTEDNRHAELPLAAHGLIGDGFSVALVRVDGVIPWLCWPRFDSPAVFAALLDSQRGGLTAVSPARRPYESLQRYDPDTNVLETLFTVPGQGIVRLTDFMPWSNDPRASVHELHRRIECVEGEVELEALFDPRFDYGASPTRLEPNAYGLLARGPTGATLSCVMDDPAPWQPRPEGGLACRFALSSGHRRWMVLAWGVDHTDPIISYRPFEQLRTTRHHWRRWSSQLTYDGPFRHHVLRSALCLKLLIYAPTGAMVAAPTTSLPEWPGGSRNWDYRYSWARDAAMAIRAANLLGFTAEARDFFHFLRDTLDPARGLQVMYAIDGQPVPGERVLEHLSGHQGSRPARTGNGARDQVQLDTAGTLVDTAHLYEYFGSALPLRAWHKLRHVIAQAAQHWREPDHGIWEPRSELRHHIHSKLMCWVALQRGAGLATIFGEDDSRDRWEHEARAIAAELCRHGTDAEHHHFIAAYGEPVADAALLLIPIYGLFPEEHPLVRNTVEWVRQQLSAGPFLYRYRGVDDGLCEPEGAFLLCGFWLAEALCLLGRLDEAQAIFVAHAEASNHLGLLAEQIEPLSRALLGNFPQAFSHLGLINAALRLDLGLRMRDEGESRRPRFLRDGLRRWP